MAKIRYKIYRQVMKYTDENGLLHEELSYSCVVKEGLLWRWKGIVRDEDTGEYRESFYGEDLAEFSTPEKSLEKTIDVLFKKEEEREEPSVKVKLIKKGKVRI